MRRLLTVLFLMMPSASLALPLWTGNQGGVVIDQAVLDDVMAKSAQQFSLPVEGKDYRVQVEAISEPNLGVTSLIGRIDGDPESFFLLCLTDAGAVVAFFQPGNGSAYRLSHIDGTDKVQPVDYASLGGCAGALEAKAVTPRTEQSAVSMPLPDATRSVANDGSRHDILIAYTTNAETVMGGWDYIRAEAQLAVDAANLVYDNSGVTSNLRLVHLMGTDYQEISAWDYEDHAVFLWIPNDGIMDEVLVARDLVGADFVSVLIDGRDFMGEVPTCGVGFVMQPDEINHDFGDSALSIVSVQCAAVSWTLAHEVGHNRGCAHNREDVVIDGAYPYAYGRRFVGDGDAWYRTVMAYDHFTGGYERIPHFTNPEVNYGGVPTGIWPGLDGEAHNTLTHNNTAAVCATFRDERTFMEFGWSGGAPDGFVLSPYPTLLEAMWGSLDGGTIVIQNDKPDFVGTLAGPRAYVHGGAGSAVLGSP